MDTMLILLRGLPGAVDYQQFSKSYNVDYVVSPWDFVKKEEKVIDHRTLSLLTGESWKEAHNKCRQFINKYLYEKKDVLCWFEFDKFYHLVEYKDIAFHLQCEFVVLDVYDNGLTNFELVENAKRREIYQDAITNKYITKKKSRWHFTWQRQK